MKVTFTKLGLKFNQNDYIKKVSINAPYMTEAMEIEVKTYLPQEEKAELIGFVVNNAIDYKTNTFSPIRLETYWGIGIIKWYTNINFTEKQIEDAPKTYDKLEANNIIQQVLDWIPEDEINFTEKCLKDTIADISKYANSFLGMIQAMSADASLLDEEMNSILTRMKNKDGIEELSSIRDALAGKTITK